MIFKWNRYIKRIRRLYIQLAAKLYPHQYTISPLTYNPVQAAGSLND